MSSLNVMRDTLVIWSNKFSKFSFAASGILSAICGSSGNNVRLSPIQVSRSNLQRANT
ncbi:hypothetical protein [Enterocloster sp.]|uniref:hypothetical protein n=1 Tax=Enterocloster sp. TaxID=2719315 RepID=UPI0015B6E703